MRAFLTATALAGTLALMPVAALAQYSSDQAPKPETQGAPTPETQAAPTPETQSAPAPETQATEAPDAQEFRVVTGAEDLKGFDAAEVRVESVEEVPRDQVQAINNSLDPANPNAVELREELTGIEGVQQALSEENVEEERIVGAAMEENELVVYVLPEGQTREQWGAQMPAPGGDAAPGAAASDQPGSTGASGADQQPGAGQSN